MVQIEITKQPLYGSVVWNGYEFIYTPKQGFTGNDVFFYKKTVNEVSTSYIEFVNPTNLPPITRNITILADAFSATTIPFSDLVTDTTDPFDSLKILQVTPVLNGSIETDGTNIYYYPNTANTIETVVYTVTDKQFIQTGVITLSVINGLVRKFPEPDTFKYKFYKTYNTSVRIPNLTSNWDSSYDVLTTYQDVWNSIDVTQFRKLANSVSAISARLIKANSNKPLYDEIYSILSANSASWISDIAVINVPTYGNDNWNNTHSILTSNSATWNSISNRYSPISSELNTKTDNYQSVYSTSTANSGIWDSRGLEIILDNTWDLTKTIVQTNSSDWNSMYNTTTTFSSTFDRESKLFNSALTALTSNISVWSDNTAETAILSASMWNAVYNNKPNYDNVYSYLTSTSADLIKDHSLIDALTSAMSSVSAEISSTQDTITANNKFDYWNKLDNVSSLSSEYDYNASYNVLTSISSISTAILSAPTWDAVYNNKLDYDNLYTYLTGASAGWINDITVLNVGPSADNYNNLYNLLTGNSAIQWNTLSYIVQALQKYDYTTVYSIITSNSAIYSNLYEYISSDNWNSVYNTVCTFSSVFEAAELLEGVISHELTAKYYSLYETITTYNQTWKDAVSALEFVKLSATLWNSMGDNIENYRLLYNTVSAASGTFVIATTATSGLSAILYDKTSKWNSTNDTLDTINIEENQTWVDVVSAIIEKGKWQFNSVNNTVTANLVKYWPTDVFYNILTSVSDWTNSNNIIFDQSKGTEWNSTAAEYNSTSTNLRTISSNMNATSNLISANSGSWNNNKNITNVFSTFSANWVEFYTTTNSYSSVWSLGISNVTFYNIVNTYYTNISANFRNTFNTITSNSAVLWLSATSILNNIVSTNFLTGSPTIAFSARNLNVTTLSVIGNLSTYGPRTILNSSVQLLSGFTINNNGASNAVLINKNGTNAVINFQALGSTVLYVKASPRVVGINLSASLVDPTIGLTVSGDISATGYTYPYPRYITDYAILSSRYLTAFNIISSASSRVIDYEQNIPKYDLLLTYINPISSFLNVTKPYYDGFYSTVASSYSAKVNYSFNYLRSNSAIWDKDVVYAVKKTNYDTAYTYITSTSGKLLNKNNISHYFTGKSKLSAKEVNIIVQDNIQILSWNLLSDVNTTITVDVLSSHFRDFINPPISIVNGNFMSLTNSNKNTQNNLSSIWAGTKLSAGSVITFKLTNNTAASSLHVNLAVQKQ